ncbi:hypothetical protein GCM10027271_13370 [Saccharopolyspora gloriosae]
MIAEGGGPLALVQRWPDAHLRVKLADVWAIQVTTGSNVSRLSLPKMGKPCHNREADPPPVSDCGDPLRPPRSSPWRGGPPLSGVPRSRVPGTDQPLGLAALSG